MTRVCCNNPTSLDRHNPAIAASLCCGGALGDEYNASDSPYSRLLVAAACETDSETIVNAASAAELVIDDAVNILSKLVRIHSRVL